MNSEPCHIIINPAAGGGRTKELINTLKPTLYATFGNETTIYVTKMQGDARGSAREAVRDGARLIVVIGGDGTIYESVNGIYSLPLATTRNVRLAVISTGTGCGLARSLGIPSAIPEQIAVASGSCTRAIDLGRVRLTKPGQTFYFVNECQVGIGAEVVRRTRRHGKAFGRSLAYTLTTVPLLFTFPNPVFDLTFEGSERITLPVTGLSIGNGAITGGGMHLTPRAILDDGLIDVLVMKGQTSFHRAASFAQVRSGKHIHSPHFEYRQVRRLEVSAKSKSPVTADGEIIGNLPAVFEVLPQVLPVHCRTQERKELYHEHAHSAA